MTDSEKPLIRWVGGKRRLLHIFEEIIGARAIRNYYEPMVGGGAIFFHFRGLAERCFLNDINISLIEAYNQIKSNPDLIAGHIQRMNAQCLTYEQLRTEFNSRTLGLSRRAALFLALNHLCFNGLYRENKAGEFNVPIGKSAKGEERTLATFPYDALISAHRALRHVNLSAAPIEKLLDGPHSFLNTELKRGDLCVFDPPYLKTFSSYNARGFGITSHAMLSVYARRCENVGAMCIVCGSNTPESLSLYGKPSQVVELQRTVGASNRGVAEEAIWVFGK